MTTLMLAVAGAGPANRTQIYDELGDWLGYGQPDQEGYLTRARKRPYERIKLILPLTDELFSAGVSTVYRWSGDAEVDFDGIISDQEPATGKQVKGAKAQAADLDTAPDVMEALIEALADAKSDEKYLLVFQEDDGSDEAAARATELAWQAGIEVRNLSYALAPLEPPEPRSEPDQDVEAEQAQEGLGATIVTFARSTDLAIDLSPALDADEDLVRKAAFDILGDLIHCLIAQDTANALLLGTNGAGPLTRSAIVACAAFQRLLSYPDGPVKLRLEAQSAPAPAPVAKGKTRREFKDPETGEWRPVGRGRPRKDVEIREVPVDSGADA